MVKTRGGMSGTVSVGVGADAAKVEYRNGYHGETGVCRKVAKISGRVLGVDETRVVIAWECGLGDEVGASSR